MEFVIDITGICDRDGVEYALTPDEANRLLNELPLHLRDMAAFSLATGLRAGNVTGLKWSNLDLDKRHAWIHPDEAKTKKAIPVSLNDDAVAVLVSRQCIHKEFVFTYQDNRIQKCSTRAWSKALERAGIENFRWHELQQLGGWSSFEMVLRYAHLSGSTPIEGAL